MRSTVPALRGTLGTEAWTPWQMSRCECYPTGRGIVALLTQDTLVSQQVLSCPQHPRLAGFLVTSAQGSCDRGGRKGAWRVLAEEEKAAKKLRGAGCRREGRGETKGTKRHLGKSDPTGPCMEEASRLLVGQLSVQVFKGVGLRDPTWALPPRPPHGHSGSGRLRPNPGPGPASKSRSSL